MNGIKYYSSCRIQCNKRQADKCNKKTCTYLQVAVHNIQRQDQQSIFLFNVESKGLHGTLNFVA